MPYSDFDLERVEAELGLVVRPGALFDGVAPEPVPGWLVESLDRNRRAAAVVSEKSRSEFIVAQMMAARLFNERGGSAGQPIYGCVTSGEAWQFLKLDGDSILLDARRLYIDNLGGILAILRAIVGAEIGGRDDPPLADAI